MKAKLAFYKGKGDLTDKAIRLWTKSKYSHVELVYNNMWYSTSPRDLKVRSKFIVDNSNNWEYVDIDIDENYLIDFFNRTQGAKYDWLGIFLSQFLHLNIQNRKRWFCSEWCAEALKLQKSNQYSPESLYNKIKKL